MNMLEKHKAARQKINVYIHNIRTEYKGEDNKIFIVCEGREDLGYYGQVIKRKYSNIKIRKQYVGGREAVLKTYNAFDWSRYKKNRILFFIDCDFSYWKGEKQFIDTNVYITEQYSFENDAVNEEMFLEILEDCYGFANAQEAELEEIKRTYSKLWEKFYENSMYIMASVFVSNYVNRERYAKKISINKMIKIEDENIWVKSIKGQPVKEYLYENLQLTKEHESAILKIKKQFEDDRQHYFVRGKWALGFMVKTLEYIMNNAEYYAPSLYQNSQSKPNRACQLTNNGTMILIAPRMKPVRSLEKFLEANLCDEYTK